MNDCLFFSYEGNLRNNKKTTGKKMMPCNLPVKEKNMKKLKRFVTLPRWKNNIKSMQMN